MSEQTEGVPQDERLEERYQPSVLVAVAGSKREIPLNYENVEIEYQADYGISTAKFFNTLGARKSIDFFVFLGDGLNFDDETSLNSMLDIVQSDRFVGFGGLYTDLRVVHEGEELCCRYSPSYSVELLQKRIPLNIPFLIAGQLFPVFHEEIEALSLWDGMLSVASKTMLFHVPKPLFQITNALATANLSHELERIHAFYFS